MQSSALTLRAIVATFGVLLLTACTHQPPHEWLSEDSFATQERVDARIDLLEKSLTSRCVSQMEHDLAQARLVNALDGRMEWLREEIRSLEREPRLVVRDCPPPPPPAPPAEPNGMHVLGRVEWVGLPSIGTYLKARVDTGANLASISAAEIVPFERDGKNWIRFKLGLSGDDVVVDEVRDLWLEAPVERHVRIVQAAGTERRAVISLPMTLGPIEQRVEFTVNDRSHLPYPVLLGRRFMMDIAMVDVSRSYVHARPEFPGGAPAAQAARDQTDPEESEELED